MTNKLGPGLSWRLVHDGTNVLLLEEMSGITETAHSVFESQTLHECIKHVAQLGLQIPPELMPQEAQLSVEESVSPRQIRQAMNRVPYGQTTLRDAVEAAVAAGDRDLQDWWEFSTAVDRTNPQVTVMAQALGIDDAALDELWALAATL